jgi:hypothetical protein
MSLLFGMGNKLTEVSKKRRLKMGQILLKMGHFAILSHF